MTNYLSNWSLYFLMIVSGMPHRTRTLFRILKKPTIAVMHFHGILVGLIAYLKKKVQKSGTIKIMSIYQLN